MNLLSLMSSTDSGFAWIPFIVGGVIGAVLISLLFDWAVIILSSLSGAMMIVQAVPIDSTIRTVVFFVLLLFGIIVQARLMRRRVVA